MELFILETELTESDAVMSASRSGDYAGSDLCIHGLCDAQCRNAG
jgi:hypothetical protein